MSSSKIAKKRHGGGQNKQHRRKALLVGLLIPLGLVCAGTATVGALYGTGIISPRATKTTLETVFGSPSLDGNAILMGNSSTPIPRNTAIDYVSIWNDILKPNLHGYPESIFNDLDITLPTWQFNVTVTNEVTVSAKQTSAEYAGSITITFILAPGVQNLSADLKTVLIDLPTLQDSSLNSLHKVTEEQLLNAIKLSGTSTYANSDLNINDIKITYDTNPSGQANYDDWNWTKEFGIGSGSDVNQDTTLTLWNQQSQWYDHLKVAPNGGTYYAGSAPVAIQIRLKRLDIATDIADWSTFRNTALPTNFYTQPSQKQVKTAFDTAISSKSWKNNFIANDVDYEFSFPSPQTSTNTLAYLTYPGNPFYNTMSGGDNNDNSKFTYTMYIKEEIGTDILTTAQIANLNDCFYQLPSRTDIIDAIIGKISGASSYLWSQIVTDISDLSTTSGKVDLVPVNGSLYYTGSREISFNYK